MTLIKESLQELLSSNEPLLDQAKRLFLNFPKAQDVWVKLGTIGGGGVIETIKTLGIKDDYDKCFLEYSQLFRDEKHESAAMVLNEFIKFCKQQVLDNYHKFA